MKNKKKAAWIAAVTIAVVILLCACRMLQPEDAVEMPEGAATIRILTIGETSEEALERVSKALSEITMERLGCRVELKMLRPEEYDERIDDLLLESDFTDIFVCRNRTTMNELLDGNYIYRLDRYLKEFPEFREVLSNEEIWAQTEVDEYTYAIPFGNDNAYQWGFVMRQDICDELGIDTASITTLESLHQVLLNVKEAYPDMIPVVSNYGEMATFSSVDVLVSGGGCLVTEQGVSHICELPEFRERCSTIRRWYQEGLIQSDAPFGTESCEEWLNNGLAFGAFMQMDRYTERELEYTLDFPIACAELNEVFYGDAVSDMSFAVYAYTEDVNLCLQVLRLIYTDQEVLRMCIYGQEGIDYEWSASGAVVSAPRTEGTNRFVNWCWALRGCAAPPVKQEDPDWYVKKGKTAETFFFDNQMVSNEIYQCSEVLEKYFGALTSGLIDANEGISMMNDDLKAANVETVYAELVNQRDAWMSEKSK